MDRETDRQTERQTKKTDRQKQGYMDIERGRWTD